MGNFTIEPPPPEHPELRDGVVRSRLPKALPTDAVGAPTPHTARVPAVPDDGPRAVDDAPEGAPP